MTQYRLAARFIIASVCAILASGYEVKAASVKKAPIVLSGQSHDSGWLPFEIRNGNRILLPVTVNGRAVQAFLDSGSSEMTLDTKFAAVLHARSDPSVVGRGVGGNGLIGEAHEIHFQLGRITINPEQAAIIDESEDEARLGVPMPVTVGGEAFGNTVVDVDFFNHRIAFRDPQTFEVPQNAFALPLHRVGKLRAIDMTVEGRPARMVLDMGTGAPVFLYSHYWNQPEFLANRRLSTTFAGGWASAKPEKITMLQSVGVSSATFSGLYANLFSAVSGTSKDLVDGNIGMPILSRFHLIFDFPRNRVFFASPIDSVTPFTVNHTGLYLRKVAAGESIIFVAPKSPAEHAGLKVGSIVTAIEDIATKQAITLASRWPEAPTGRTLLLSLASGETVTIITGTYF